MERLIQRRRETPEIAFGEWRFVPVDDAAILAMRYDWGGRSVIVIHNLADKPCKASFQLERASGASLTDLFGADVVRLLAEPVRRFENVLHRKTFSVRPARRSAWNPTPIHTAAGTRCRGRCWKPSPEPPGIASSA
jgi:hypothetical protein